MGSDTVYTSVHCRVSPVSRFRGYLTSRDRYAGEVGKGGNLF